jgi:microcin C transport system substrate-binding protein
MRQFSVIEVVGPRVRKILIAASILGLAAIAGVAAASADDPAVRRHALSTAGDLKHNPDFKHFDWVDPDAPKGGLLRLAATGTFDSLNGYTYRGVSAPLVSLLNDTLMEPNPDEPAASYGLVAEWVSMPADVSSASFGLRKEARFHDGRPITPDDVIFSLDAMKKASPSMAIMLRDVSAAEKTGDHEVTFRFARAGSRDLPFLVSFLPILPKHYWTAVGSSGEPRDIVRTTLEAPLGSGPYRIKTVDPGRSITYERVADYWAKDLPVRRGQYNFGEIRVTMYRDDVPEFEAVKAGDVDIHPERISRRWATQYDIPAVRDGRLVKLVHHSEAVAQMQGFVLNTRRAKFTDPRVRRAFALAYDFESANTSLFYGLYKRTNGFFDNSELAPRGVPEGIELALLEKWRAQVPPEVFGQPYRSPVNATPAEQRENLREALRLLGEAGWKVANGVLRHQKTGETMTVEFLNYDATFDRIVLPYQRNLAKLGIRVDIRIVDATQYEERLKGYDFEMITDVYAQSHAPGNELRENFGSAAADRPASRNRIGIKSPAVDAIVEDIIYASDRAHVVAGTRALDRVLMWNHLIVPQWHNADNWLVHSNRIGRPQRMPSQDPAWLAAWWIKPEAQAGTAQPGKAKAP